MTNSNKKILGVKIHEAAGVYTQSVLNNDVKALKLIDVLIAGKIPPTHLRSPSGKNAAESTASPEWFKALKDTIEAQYSEQVHALMEMSSKAAGNTYVGANNRDGWTKKANSIIGGMRTAYINRLKKQGLIESGKMAPDARTKTPEVKVHELITEARSRIQKADTFECRLDIEVVVKQLSEILKAIA
jgi:hypothetical protein